MNETERHPAIAAAFEAIKPLSSLEYDGIPELVASVAAAAVLRWVADLAVACTECGKGHEYRPDAAWPGRYTWAHPVDGHPYRRTVPEEMSTWLRNVADEIEPTKEETP